MLISHDTVTQDHFDITIQLTSQLHADVTATCHVSHNNLPISHHMTVHYVTLVCLCLEHYRVRFVSPLSGVTTNQRGQ